MQNKIKLILLLLLGGPLSAQSVFYIEPHVSRLVLAGTPDIGDIGRETGSDLPAIAAGITVGYEVSPRLSLELRFTHLGELTIGKVSPYATVFPPKPGDGVALVVSDYKFTQRTDLFAAALPFQLWKHDRLSLQLTPLLQLERSEVVLTKRPLSNPGPAGTVLAEEVFLRRSTTDVQPGAEIALGCRLSDHTALQLHYTYTPLSTCDAHLIGAGLQARF